MGHWRNGALVKGNRERANFRRGNLQNGESLKAFVSPTWSDVVSAQSLSFLLS